jgi:hypothetical protein
MSGDGRVVCSPAVELPENHVHLHDGARAPSRAVPVSRPKETAASLAWGGHANRRRRADT